MVIAETLAGAAAGAHALWDYNRDNFLYDRKMRAETELKVLEWRVEQSGLWRDDVRDLVGLTEKKMDSYLVVSTLQLGMCLGLFTEGRLEPGTPPWLIHFYALTLAAAFMYLLMSVWLAVHASIVAQSSAVRLLTQFVRLPIPSWESLQNMRTFASSFEHLDTKHLMRVPFTRQGGEKQEKSNTQKAVGFTSTLAALRGSAGSSDDVGSARKPGDAKPDEEAKSDPWQLENSSIEKRLYELDHAPARMRRHVCLARRAARQFQCYDAFSRVAMAFGTNQLLHALCYFALGYVFVQDGAMWPALCVVALMCAIGVSLIDLDFDLTMGERCLAKLLILAGPACVASAAVAWSLKCEHAHSLLLLLLPLGYASHGAWLLFALAKLGLQVQTNGTILPQKFRAVLYMDVFGLLKGRKKGSTSGEGRSDRQFDRAPFREEAFTGRSAASASDAGKEESLRDSLKKLKKDLKSDMKLWKSDQIQRIMEEGDKERADLLLERAQKAMQGDESPNMSRYSTRQSADGDDEFVKLTGYTDFGGEAPYLYNPKTGEARMLESHEDDEVDEEMGESQRDILKALPDAASSSRPSRERAGGVRSMTAFEDGIERYCSTKAAQRKSELAASRRLPNDALRRPEAGNILDAAKLAMSPMMEAILPENHEDREHHEDMTDYRDCPAEDLNQKPSGELHGGLADFAPESYTPFTTVGLDGNLQDNEEIVTGHDKMDAGRLPAKVFRLATIMMVLLWTLGLLLPFGVFREFMTKPLLVEIGEQTPDGVSEAMVGTRPDGLPELIPWTKKLPELGKGQLMDVDWPFDSGFIPRSVCSDPSGTKLAVADDLGVFAGRVIEEEVHMDGVEPSMVAHVHFRRVPPCTALEGQAIQDISVTCEPDDLSRCRLVVLHAKGHHLAECPLQSWDGDHSGYAAQLAALPVTDPVEWKISESWLHKRGRTRSKMESVTAIATNSACVDSEGGEVASFRAESAGCVVVGTSEGRIVQLRGAKTDPQRLVPETSMEQRKEPLNRGSLHVFNNDFVMVLRHDTRTVQAFDSNAGSSVGEWRLPKNVDWLTIGGGGGTVFLLGLAGRGRNESSTATKRVQLYKFAVPDELKKKMDEGALARSQGLSGPGHAAQTIVPHPETALPATLPATLPRLPS
eukprot:TRINITY_DN32047_c0_g1_i1.p1 TRINITY_DN32047_c0_g1~~TRINITY_DN32047_c0_g1_i1.p1  ORF type:complete len:1145 (-),score=197.74 TRINITY_DN32047_c0_g1_i1:69-3503(-)